MERERRRQTHRRAINPRGCRGRDRHGRRYCHARDGLIRKHDISNLARVERECSRDRTGHRSRGIRKGERVLECPCAGYRIRIRDAREQGRTTKTVRKYPGARRGDRRKARDTNSSANATAIDPLFILVLDTVRTRRIDFNIVDIDAPSDEADDNVYKIPESDCLRVRMVLLYDLHSLSPRKRGPREEKLASLLSRGRKGKYWYRSPLCPYTRSTVCAKSAWAWMKFLRGSTASPISMSKSLSAFLGVIHRHLLHQAVLRIHRGLPKLFGIHFSETLIALDVRHALAVAR